MIHITRSLAWVCGMGLLLFLPGTIVAQADRAGLAEPPLETVKRVLVLMQEGKAAEVTAALDSIKTVTDGMKTNFGVDLRAEFDAALVKQDPAAAGKAALMFAFYDLRALHRSILTEGRALPKEKLQGWHKQSYVDYLYLAPELAKRIVPAAPGREEEKGMVIDSRIRKLFTNANLALGTKSPYARTEAEVNLEAYQRLVEAIAAEIMRVCPEFAPPPPPPPPAG